MDAAKSFWHVAEALDISFVALYECEMKFGWHQSRDGVGLQLMKKE